MSFVCLVQTNAGPLLTAINPFEDLGNTSDWWIKKYAEGDAGKLDPHVFTITRLALDNLHTAGKNQTIIVSGESGAGKTEATKQMMRYFAKAKPCVSGEFGHGRRFLSSGISLLQTGLGFLTVWPLPRGAGFIMLAAI